MSQLLGGGYGDLTCSAPWCGAFAAPRLWRGKHRLPRFERGAAPPRFSNNDTRLGEALRRSLADLETITLHVPRQHYS